jgi:hypothetical protein
MMNVVSLFTGLWGKISTRNVMRRSLGAVRDDAKKGQCARGRIHREYMDPGATGAPDFAVTSGGVPLQATSTGSPTENIELPHEILDAKAAFLSVHLTTYLRELTRGKYGKARSSGRVSTDSINNPCTQEYTVSALIHRFKQDSNR